MCARQKDNLIQNGMSGSFLSKRTRTVLGQLNGNSGVWIFFKGSSVHSGTPCSEMNCFSRDARSPLARGLFFTP